MKILLVSLLVLAILAFIIGYFRNRKIERLIKQGKLDQYPEAEVADAECCGAHTICPTNSLLAAVSESIEYYEDEQLDRFAGQEEQNYTDEEIEEFRDILYTMQEEDVAGWNRSLQLRNISLPKTVKEEVLMMIGEMRNY